MEDSFFELQKVENDIKQKTDHRSALHDQIGIENIKRLGIQNKALNLIHKFKDDAIGDIIKENDIKKIKKLKSVFDFYMSDLNYTETNQDLWTLAKEEAALPPGLPFPKRFGLSGIYLRYGRINMIGAAPGAGKTTTALCILYDAIKKGKRCVFYTFEMPKGELLIKLSGIAYYYYLEANDQVSDDLAFSDIAKGIKADNEVMKDFLEMARKYLTVVDSTGWTASKIVGSLKYIYELDSAKGNEMVDYVFVDYLQRTQPEVYMKNNPTFDKMNETIHTYTRGAKESKSIWVILSQLNRENKKGGEPDMTGLKGSGNIEEDAALGLLLSRKKDADSGRWENRMALIIDKNRYGMIKKAFVGINPQSGAVLGNG